MLRVTPIYGSRWSDDGVSDAPECSLVEFSGCRVLWNVGWWGLSSEPFPDLPDHDCCIVTHSTLQACGGLPLYYKAMLARSGSPPPIYATYPTVKMGQMALYDQHASISLDGGCPPYSLDELDQVFHAVQSIKYSQSLTIRDVATGQPSLSITAHRAGHVVGGAFYTMQRIQDETLVVLTSVYHIARELHLDSSTLLQHARTPDVLITHPGGPAYGLAKALAHSTESASKPPLPPLLVSQAERQLTETVLSVLRRDGNVLLPADASGRVLELLLLLQQQWEKNRLAGTYNLCWLGPMVRNTAEFARCQLEWMAAQLGQEFDTMGQHPLRFNKTFRLCTTVAELQAYMESNQNPTCVVATGLHLEAGPARDVLLLWADNPDHAIIFTDSSQCYARRAMSSGTASRNMEQTMSSTTATPSEGGPALVENLLNVVDAAETVSNQSISLQSIPPLRTAAKAMKGNNTTINEDDDEDLFQAEPAVVIDEESSSPWTTAAQLLAAWTTAKREDREMDDVVVVDVHVPHRAPLSGAELKAFWEREESARIAEQAAQEERAMLREVEIAKGQLRLGEDDAATEIRTTVATTTSVVNSTSTTRPRKKSRFDSTLFLKFSKPLHLVFDYREEAVGIAQPDSTAKYGIGESVGRSGEIVEDDYGIAVQHERFIDIVSGVDPSKLAGGTGRIGDDVSRRGFGYVAESKRFAKTAGGANKISDDEENQGEIDIDEQALEAMDLSEGNGIIRGRNGRQPTKVGTSLERFEVLAEISFIPLEGRVDARAARQSVRALQPRQVVVLGGKCCGVVPPHLVDEVSLLAEASAAFAISNKNVCTPSDGETVELHVGHAAYNVRLIDIPYRTAEEKASSDEAPEPIEPFEAKLGGCTVSMINYVATGQKVALDGSIVLAPHPASTAANDMPSLYVSDGDILLIDLRSEMVAQGMKAEYSTQKGISQLLVNGKILVRKDQDTGRIYVEGPLCEDFFLVRGIVCNQYLVL